MKKWRPITSMLAMIFLHTCSSSTAFGEGPQGGITLKVIDDKNQAVSDARIEAQFDNVPEQDIRTGKTNANGIYYFEGRAVSRVLFVIGKDGYYETIQEYSFARNAPSWNEPTKRDKWVPWNPTFIVTLKKVRKPTPMYVKRVEYIRVPLDQPVGFDFEVGECVAPHGKGVISDVIFRVGEPKEMNSRRHPLGFSFRNPLDGIEFLQREAWSKFFSLYEAPESGYGKVFEQVDQLFRDPNPLDTKQWYYVFRVRTASGTDGRLLSAQYAKMTAPVNVTCKEKECQLRFQYWYNPDGTPNLEYDTKKNLFKNLMSGLDPHYP